MGSGIAQVITFAATPILTRIYNPEAFGEQSAILSLVGLIAALSTMAFPIAIVVARSDLEALALARLALLGSLVIAPIITLLLLAVEGWTGGIGGISELERLFLTIPLLVVFVTLNLSAGYIFTRTGAFGLYAKAQLGAAIAGSATKILFGWYSPDTLSLIAGNALGYLVVPILAFRVCQSQGLRVGSLSVRRARLLIRRYRDFPLLRAPQNFISAASQALPVMGLTAAFGAGSAGYYSIALTVAGAPIILIGNAAQSVLYPKLTKSAHARGKTTPLLVQSTLGLAFVGAPFFLFIALFGPSLFAMLLGQEWSKAGSYAALLVPFLWLGLANRPAVSLIPSLGIQRDLLVYEIISTAAKSIGIIIGCFVLRDPYITVVIFSAIGALSYFVLIDWVIFRSLVKDKGKYAEAS